MRQWLRLAWLTVLACVLVVACGPGPVGPTIEWDLQGTWGDEQRAAFDDSCAQWNAIAKVQQSVVPGGFYEVRILPHDQIPYPPDSPSAVALMTRRSKIMYVDQGLPGPSFHLAVLHEQGHALGLAWDAPGGERGHPPTGVMALGAFDPFVNPIKLTEADLAECRRVQACE